MRAPAEFVYDHEQVILELRRAREEEEERRHFVEGLRRLRGDVTCSPSSEPGNGGR